MPNSVLHQMVIQMNRAWAETDAAQRRLMEIQTGVPMPRRRRWRRGRAAAQASVAELERLFALPHHG